jgi:hypothetical protein
MPVEIQTSTQPPASGVPGSIDTLFAVGEDTGLGSGTVTLCRSVNDYIAAGGSRAGDPATFDGLDNFFREGGKRAQVAVGADVDAALALFTQEMGGGQVVAWGETPGAATAGKLLDFAEQTSRYALIDVAATDDTTAEMQAAAGAVPDTNNDYGLITGPWVTIPAPSGVLGGSARQVPASSTVAALIARADSLGNPNRAPAGRDFPLQYATGVGGAAVMSDQDATTLRNAGLNPLRRKLGLYVLDGFQTTRPLDPDDPFWQANCGRARMWLQWQSLIVGYGYEYKTIDGKHHLERALQSDLEAVCASLYAVDGLFGESPQDAYHVEVGVSVNNLDTIAQGELHAVVEARLSVHARTIIINLVSVPVTGQVTVA